jgi:phosphatidylglycerol lysyltransferase
VPEVLLMITSFKNTIKKISPKTYWKEIFAVFILLLAFVFFRSERKELKSIVPQLHHANGMWILIGVAVTCIYVLLQAAMYIKSFRAIGLDISIKDAVELFLKRNLLSVFLPAGGISSLAYTPTQLRRKNLNTTKIHQAGAIYAYVGLLTVFFIGVPVVLYTLWKHQDIQNAWVSLMILGFLLLAVLGIIHSLRTKGAIYKFITKKFPSIVSNIDEIFSGEINRKHLLGVILYSTLIEFCGIAHAFIAMYALNLPVSFEAAAVGYTVSVVLMIISPFLRGLGAVEFTMLFIMNSYGYSHAEGLGITLIYRFFEFWLPLLLGIVAFVWRGRQVVARIFPAIAIFFLGIVNIISVATPPLAERMRLAHTYIAVEAIHASNLMVLVLGIALVVTAAFLIKGMRAAWIAALVFSILSVFGNIGKALDYEEALLALFIFLLLISSSSQYRIKTSRKWLRFGITTFLIALFTVCLFDFLSFYFIDKRHFGIDFTWRQSIYHTAKSFLLFSDDSLQPLTIFGRDFLNIIRFLGVISWLLLIYTIVKPRIPEDKSRKTARTLEKAKEILKEYGRSAVDHFKIAYDKIIFLSENTDGFISYKIANGFAVVLEEPVCAEEDKLDILKEFENYCKKGGFNVVYYRVGEEGLYYYNAMGKRKMLIGQEAIMEVASFTLEGKDKKSLRNGLNSLQKKGVTISVFTPPHEDVLLSELETVSREWLADFNKKELTFSQGSFDKKELQTQDIIAVKNAENGVEAFLNIIPDYTPEECTYDMIRRRANAPGGAMDALIVELISYCKQKNYKYLNLGLIPLSGFNEPNTAAEQIMKFASTRVGSFKQYQRLKNFKEKYATIWENKYLIYKNDFDLVQLPGTLRKIMKVEE